MNSKLFIAAAVAMLGIASASPALATTGEATPDYPMPFTSTVSRAEVQQATARALAAGLIPHGERSVVVEATGTALTRAQVQAETLEAIRVGAISRGEHNTFATPEQLESIRMAGQKAVRMAMSMSMSAQ